MADYTKPWKIRWDYGVYVEDTLIASTAGSPLPKENKQANAQRIVDCVNGCEGIENPLAVKDLYEALKSWDKLRAMQPLDSGADIDAILQECANITDKALLKVEGKQ